MDVRFNRTFMELKYIRIERLQDISEGFNRTFMELKSATNTNTNINMEVLIVPLWN